MTRTTSRAVGVAAMAIAIAASARVAAAGHHCHETSAVLGRRHCGGFGSSWATSALQGLAIGFMDSTFVAERLDVPAHVHIDSVETAAGAPAGSRTALVGDPGATLYGFRSGLFWRGDYLTLAFEATGEGGTGPAVLSTVDGHSVVSHPPAISAVFALTPGVHRRYGRVDLGAELAVGTRMLDYAPDLPAGFDRCTQGRACNVTVVSEGGAVVMPRVRVDYFVARQLTIGVSVGHAVIGDGDVVGISIAAHQAPYDGY
jgi:hypothetical protein|nr:hypothetical protein [Kofleriaceae bacterium]